MVIDVGDCVSLKSPGERLDCYERHVEAAKRRSETSPAPTPEASAAPTPAEGGATSPSPASAPTPAAPATAPSALAAGAAVAAPAVATVHAPTPQTAPPVAQPPEIAATVTELHETVPNAWLITLDNGQVWRQKIPQRFALKPGQHVTLRGTRWGASYRLTAETLNGFIQVERVR